MTDEILPWVLFNAFIIVMLALDLFIFHKKPRAITLSEAARGSFCWISLALLFNIYIYYSRGHEAALNFLTGYLIEESLSIDNLFVFLLIFKYFHTPSTSLHRVLFWGIFATIVMRALFIWLGIVLISHFHWMTYLFGGFLVFTGITLWIEKDKQINPEKNPILKLFHYLIPCTHKYENDRFFILKNSKYVATPLFVVLIVIETTDLIFALDSIPAILAITNDPFIVYTSNIFALLGLRSLYFLIQHMMMCFHYLHYGLSVILVFIGIKMLLIGVFKIPILGALGVVFLVLLFSVLLSIFFPNRSISSRK